MQLVTQTKFPQRGNCFRACLATLLSLGIDEIPPFEEQSENTWLEAKRWLLTQGFTLRNYHSQFSPTGYSIAVGQSPRNPNISHAVVALNGTQYFDPHPDRKGLVSIDRYWQIEELESTKERLKRICREIALKPPIFIKPLSSEPVEEKSDDDMRICSYPKMSPQERYEFRKNNRPSLKFEIDTIAIKIINEAQQPGGLLENTPKIKTIPSSGNVYADMGLDDPEEMLEKAFIVMQVNKNIEILSAYDLYLRMPLCEDLDLPLILRGNFREASLDRLKKLEADLSTGLDPWEQN